MEAAVKRRGHNSGGWMSRRTALGIAWALTFLLAPGAFAQFATGNLYGTVADSSGAALPGATLSLTGGTIGKKTTTTGPQGDFRFLGLDPGTYTLSVELQGFASVKRDVVVNTAAS